MGMRLNMLMLAPPQFNLQHQPVRFDVRHDVTLPDYMSSLEVCEAGPQVARGNESFGLGNFAVKGGALDRIYHRSQMRFHV